MSFSQMATSRWTRWVGTRYLRSKKNSKFMSFITLISVLGVALGVTAMIVVLSVMDGFEAELKKRLMTSDVHLLVTPTEKTSGFDSGFAPESALDPALVSKALSGELATLTPVISTEVVLKTGRKVTGVQLKGVNADRLAKIRTETSEVADPNVIRRALEAKTATAFVGQELAYELGVIPGDMITIISPTETEGPMGGVPRLKRFIVEGVYHSGLPENELHSVFTSEGAVRSFLRRANAVSQWDIAVTRFDDAPELGKKLQEAAPEFRVRDWIDLNSHLFYSLKLERIAMFVILAFIVVVASFNIVTTLTLMVLEKKREISILKAMGAQNSQVGAIFLWEGLLIGGVGVTAGLGLGFLLCLMLRRYDFIQLPDIYYDRTLPVTFDPKYYIGVASCAYTIVLFACNYPSRKAAQVDPLDGIRFG